MRQKELRIALVCYGGVSLAIYMHGVTKEVWKLARASRAFHAGEEQGSPVERVYAALLERIAADHELKLRVLPDILTGASAGGINAIFLAQALHSGQSIEPLTRMWLEKADVEQLVAPEARPWSRVAKMWAMPIVWFLLRRPDNAVTASVSPETRAEVRRKVSGLIRSRWFEPPFSGPGFSRMLFDAFTAMAEGDTGAPLLPPGHPLDLWVTTTDFRGHKEVLRLNSPPLIEESEHRMSIGFRSPAPLASGEGLAHPCELTLAARATASFPGAFPPLRLAEIDEIAAGNWPTRAAFLRRIMPAHIEQGTAEKVSLVDGSVLVNRPFASAIAALGVRPVQREVDRRIVYIDPRPDRRRALEKDELQPVGFFGAILGSLSTIPREQPIRDNLETIERQSFEAEKLRHMVDALRPEVEAAVDKLFGRTLFLDRPTPARLSAWRIKAQQAAAEGASFAFHSYAQAKMAGIVDRLAQVIVSAAPGLAAGQVEAVARVLRRELDARGLASLSAPGGGASAEAVAFLRAHDINFRIRRLRLLARRLTREWLDKAKADDAPLEQARGEIYRALNLYMERDGSEHFGEDFAAIAAKVFDQPGAVLDALAQRRHLTELDAQAEAIISAALEALDKPHRRRMLLTYLGFPFYDVATLPLMRNEGLTEYDPIKVDRISPEDATSIRSGGTDATLRGIEFFNFGGFFSRAYRENDYLWGRLHGAERMIDLVCSTVPDGVPPSVVAGFKRDAFIAVCDEEDERGLCASGLVAAVRAEIAERLG
jgi:patatin-related protein